MIIAEKAKPGKPQLSEKQKWDYGLQDHWSRITGLRDHMHF
jgi:hypothetical protein